MTTKRTAIAIEESHGERYPVIEGAKKGGSLERFVVACRDKESPRELIAAPSIVRIGFGSREAAVAIFQNRSARDPNSIDIQEKLTFSGDDHQLGPAAPLQGLGQRVKLAETRRIVSATLQHAIAVAVLTFYSKSILGAAIRACVGA